MIQILELKTESDQDGRVGGHYDATSHDHFKIISKLKNKELEEPPEY